MGLTGVLLALCFASVVFAAPNKPTPLPLPPVTDGCGVDTSCLAYPAGCVTTGTCQAAVSVQEEADGDVFVFEMWAEGGVYVAVGLSDDARMGSDSVVECVTSGPDSATLYTSYNTAARTNTRVTTDGVTLVDGRHAGNATYCKFTRDAVTTAEGRVFDLQHTQYHLLLVAGSTATETGVGYHDVLTLASADKRFLGEVGVFRNSPPRAKATKTAAQ